MRFVTLEDIKVGETYWVGLKLENTPSGSENVVYSFTVDNFEEGNRFIKTLPHTFLGLTMTEESLLDIGVIPNSYNQHKTFFTKEDAEQYISQ